MSTYLVVGGVVVGFIFLMMVVASLFRKAPPNRALIVYGWGGPKVTKGGGVVVLPLVQSVKELSLELMSFDVVPAQDFYTVQGVAVTVEAVAQIKVKSDAESIMTAAEQFLSKTEEEQHAGLKLVMEGHLRGIIGQLTVEQIVKEPEMVADRVLSNVANDLAKMGLTIVSFTVKEIRDKNEYITNMGRPDIERVKAQAQIAAAEAQRDAEIRKAAALQEAAVARAMADQQTVLAQTNSQAKQAEAQRDLSLKQAQYDAEVGKAKAQADKSYDIQANVMQQQVIAEQVKVQQIERLEQVKVQEAEIQRREKELIATVLKQAEIERQKLETLAEAKRRQLELEAAGAASAARAKGAADAEVEKLRGQAEAEVTRVRGTAEAEVVLAKGKAEAEAMNQKAEAYKQYNQAAVLDKLIPVLPDLMKAISEPLAKVDRITMLSTGGGADVGVNRLMTDVAKVVAQAPAMVETLTGVKIADLISSIPGLQAGLRSMAAPEQAAVEQKDAE